MTAIKNKSQRHIYLWPKHRNENNISPLILHFYVLIFLHQEKQQRQGMELLSATKYNYESLSYYLQIRHQV
jgi:hypothetical protein